jgi:hypothetical protein
MRQVRVERSRFVANEMSEYLALQPTRQIWAHRWCGDEKLREVAAFYRHDWSSIIQYPRVSDASQVFLANTCSHS